jgi:hypothetical protein
MIGKATNGIIIPKISPLVNLFLNIDYFIDE